MSHLNKNKFAFNHSLDILVTNSSATPAKMRAHIHGKNVSYPIVCILGTIKSLRANTNKSFRGQFFQAT